jgi:hypothetical protein
VGTLEGALEGAKDGALDGEQARATEGKALGTKKGAAKLQIQWQFTAIASDLSRALVF